MSGQIRHACSTRWGRLGILGGLMAFLAALTIGPWMILVPEASTCTQQYVFSQNANPTVAQWNANPAYMCTLWNNGIDDTNVVAGANIAQSKIAGLLTNTVFSDHSARHEPAGADEVGDIDILNTGTLLSLHGARHSPDTGADPIPGLTGIIGTRHKYVADAGLQANVPFTNYLVGPYRSGAVVAKTPKDITYCGGFVYVLIDDVAGGLSTVLKLTASTMALSATINLAAASVTPVAIVCGADDSVYTLSHDVGVLDSVRLERINVSDTVGTLADFNAQNLEGVVAMISDPNTANLYVIGNDNTILNDRDLIQITSGGSVTMVQDGGDAADDYADLFFFNLDGLDRIGVLRADRTASECHVRVYSTASPPALVSTALVTGAGGAGADDCRAAEFDGSQLWVADNIAPDAGMLVFDVSSMTISTNNNPITATAPNATPETMFHDGRKVYAADTGELIYGFPPYWKPDSASGLFGWNYTGELAGAVTSCGISGDGISLYVCSKNATNTEFIVTKQLAL